MSEILTIRLNNEPDEPIPWMVWSAAENQVIASGDAEHLMQVSSYAKDREIVILADTAAITLMSVAIPPGSARHLENVLPFLLEDELAQDVSQVHISLLEKNNDTAHVAIIEHKKLQGWLSSLSLAGLTTKRIVPDCLCLPDNQTGFSAAMINGRWIVRTEHAKGFSAEESWLNAILTSFKEQTQSELPTIASYSPVPQGNEFSWREEPAMLIMELLSKGVKGNDFNLLSGRYKSSNQLTKYVRYFKEVAIACVLLLFTLTIEKIVTIHQMETQAQELSELIKKEVNTVLPSVKRIPNAAFLRRTLDKEVSRLTGANSQTSLLYLLSDLTPLLQESSKVEFDSLRYDLNRSELQFNARGKDFSDFETLRSAFAEKFETELGRLNKDNNNVVTGAFVLKRNN